MNFFSSQLYLEKLTLGGTQETPQNVPSSVNIFYFQKMNNESWGDEVNMTV